MEACKKDKATMSTMNTRTEIVVLIDELELLLKPIHNDKDHLYEEDSTFPHTCLQCGWFQPNTSAHSLAQEVFDGLNKLLATLDESTAHPQELHDKIHQIFEELNTSSEKSMREILALFN